jgi:hypothetical protein
MATQELALVLGEFETAHAALHAIEGLKSKGIKQMELYSPYPVPEAYDLLEIPKSPMPKLILGGGITGLLSGFALQGWCNGIDYPINVGGKPLFSVPMMIPICFELTVLLGGLSAFFGLWALLKLPRPHHPLFEIGKFASSSIDRFWLSIATPPDELDMARARQALEAVGAKRVEQVEAEEGDQ